MDVYFVDNEINRIISDAISSHAGLANIIFEKNPELKKKFEESKEQDPTVFLLKDIGYMAVSEDEFRNVVTYNSLKISDKQKKLLMLYAEDGYKMQNIANLVKEYEKEREGR